VRIEEKEDHDVLVVAGENHDSGKKFEDYEDAYNKLEQWAKQRWTSAGEVVCKWTGQASISELCLRFRLGVNLKHRQGLDNY
jgi:hypothetical protein